MQQSLPKFVSAVRISDIGQGTNPFRIVSMRALPDQPGEMEYPREEWIDQGTGDLGGVDMAKRNKGERAMKDSVDRDQAGDYVVCVLSPDKLVGCSRDGAELRGLLCISGPAWSGGSTPLKEYPVSTDNFTDDSIVTDTLKSLLLEFFLGFADWIHIPIPIWVQVDGIAGTVRLRIQFISEAPFVRNVRIPCLHARRGHIYSLPPSLRSHSWASLRSMCLSLPSSNAFPTSSTFRLSLLS
jgi:hypothetical protein